MTLNGPRRHLLLLQLLCQIDSQYQRCMLKITSGASWWSRAVYIMMLLLLLLLRWYDAAVCVGVHSLFDPPFTVLGITFITLLRLSSNLAHLEGIPQSYVSILPCDTQNTLLTKIQGPKVDASRVTKRHSTTTTAATAFVADRCPRIPNVRA